MFSQVFVTIGLMATRSLRILVTVAVGTHPTGMFSCFITGFVEHISILQFVPSSETGQNTADAMTKSRP